MDSSKNAESFRNLEHGEQLDISYMYVCMPLSCHAMPCHASLIMIFPWKMTCFFSPKFQISLQILLSVLPILICFNLVGLAQSDPDSEGSILQSFIQQSRTRSSDGDELGLSDWIALANDPISAGDHCKWAGIDCSDSGLITKLDLQSRGLTSPLPTIICSLPSLTHLILANNSYTEAFPAGLFNCTNLSWLDLSNNSFHGSLPQEAEMWSKLSRLAHLDLNNNSFVGQFPPAIATELLGLEYLSIWSNKFNGFIPDELGNLTHLKNLTIAWNAYNPNPIPPSLSKLSNLLWLYCAQCNLVGPFPSWLPQLQSLQVLDLSGNQLHGSIPTAIFSDKPWPNIARIELYANAFSGPIPASFGNMSTLTDLDLSSNRFDGSIPPELGKLENLSLLNLWNNSLGGHIPPELENLTNLETFQVYQNNLMGTIPQGLGRSGAMRIFDVSTNFLQGSIPPYLCHGNALEKLISFANNLSGSIPEAYGQCDSLQRVRVHSNRLSGFVPDNMWGLPRLYIIEFYDNNLGGTISSSHLSDAIQLVTLKISGNSFTGELPDSIGLLAQLQVLDVSGNRFYGDIPQTLQNCHALSEMSLRGNGFTGFVPDNFGTLTKLQRMDLSGNQLSGGIPTSLANLGLLSILNLSHNHLSGSVPSDLAILRASLDTFDVSYNDLSGNLPFPLGGAFTEQSFQGNDKLCIGGGIDSCGNDKPSSRTPWILGSSLLVVLMVVVVGACCLHKRRIQTHYHKMRKENSLSQSYVPEDWTFTPFQKVAFTQSQIVRSLNEDNIIGRGGSGQVYYAKLDDGEHLAIKKIWISPFNSRHHNPMNLYGDYGFRAEVETLGRVRHSNIVKLICCCTNDRTNTSLLVYEYMTNGSLGDVLFNHKSKPMALGWDLRLKIALGSARGLAYLHHDCMPPIVHRDVKSNNILLDARYEAHIADFGLAKILNNEGDSKGFNNSGVAGSVGYMAPEIGYASKVTEKSDVYSYGVVLLELLTGKRASSVEAEFGPGVDLVRWVQGKLTSRREVVESLLFFNHTYDKSETNNKDSVELHEMLIVLKLALQCTNRVASQRPSMQEVVDILEEIWLQGGHCASSSMASSSKHEKKNGGMERLASRSSAFELEYCKAQFVGR